jgi:hypothetical protein
VMNVVDPAWGYGFAAEVHICQGVIGQQACMDVVVNHPKQGQNTRAITPGQEEVTAVITLLLSLLLH